MNSPKINWGILGLGKIARKFAEDLNKLPGCNLVAVGSRDIRKAKEFASYFKASTAYGSYLDLVESDEIDVVYIASPHNYHKDHTLLALNAGKHVLCEKPFAINSSEVHEMIQKARSQKLFLMEAIWTRFFPFMHKLIEIVKNKVIGEIKIVEADFGFKAPYDPKGRLYNPHLAGGALLDIGVYPIFLAQTLLGPPDEIKASTHLSNTGVDMLTAINLSWSSGQIANLYCCITAETKTEAKIYGTEGSIYVPSRWHEAKKLSVQVSQNVQNLIFEDEFYGFAYEIKEVNRCIRAGLQESPILPLSFSKELMNTLDSIRDQIGLVYPSEK